jgi:hypothetical protein
MGLDRQTQAELEEQKTDLKRELADPNKQEATRQDSHGAGTPLQQQDR